MTNWDDHRIFLAVARSTSIRKAALALNVSHSTVLRRINIFEETLGVRLFERTPQGYFTTPAGDEMRISSLLIEQETIAVNRRIAGRDSEIKGKIRVTLPSILASHLLMPDFATFRQLHPEIELEIIPSYSLYNLSRSEADVAIRFTNDPPEDLFGRRVLNIARAAYVSADYLPKRRQDRRSLNWIGAYHIKPSLKWLKHSDYSELSLGTYICDPLLALEAAKSCMGMTVIPCFLGDMQADVIRLPPGTIQQKLGLWVLTHEDLSKTARIRIFLGFMAEAIERHRSLLEGRMPRISPTPRLVNS